MMGNDERDGGARGRDRTADTAIFSRMLYQLSYPGEPPRPVGRAGERRQSAGLCVLSIGFHGDFVIVETISAAALLGRAIGRHARAHAQPLDKGAGAAES